MGATAVPIIAGAVSAVGSIAGSMISSSGARSANEESMDFTRSENQVARQFAEHMYDRQFSEGNHEYDRRQYLANQQSREMTDWLYKNYNSPQAMVSALRKAGINPAAVFSSGGSGFAQTLQESAMPSVSPPSGISAPTSSSVQLQNPNASFASSIGEVASAFNQILSGIKTNSETETIEKTRDALITNMVLKNSGQEIANEVSEFNLNLDKAFKSKRIVLELKKLEQDGITAYYNGEHEKALSIFVDLQSKLAEYQHKCNQEMLPYLQENAKQIALGFKLENAIKQTSADANRAMASASYASARLSNAQAQTEDDLRTSKVSISKSQALQEIAKANISEHDFVRSLESFRYARNVNQWRNEHPKTAAVLDGLGYTIERLSTPLIGGLIKLFK